MELACRTELDELTRPAGLTALQYTALTVLEQHPDLTAAHLARHSFVTSQSMADMVTALLDRGLIERHRDPADRRRLVIALTPGGRALLDELRPRVAELEAQMLAPLDRSEVRELRQALQACRQALRARSDARRGGPEETTSEVIIRKPVHQVSAVVCCGAMSATPAADSTSDTATDSPKLTRGTLFAAAGAVAVAQIGLSIPAVINGYINQDLGTTSTALTWISDAFLVPVTLLELSFGVVGDLFGRKRLLAVGALLMTVGGLLGFFTPTGGTGVLITGQVISGIGAAAIFPTSVAMLAAGTRTVRERAHALSIWAAALTGAGFISPVLAGLLAKLPHSGGDFASWRYAFLAMAVLAAISAALTMAVAKNSSAPAGRSLDWPGQITIAVALFALLYAVIQGAEEGYGSAIVIVGFIAAVVFLALFVVDREAHGPAADPARSVPQPDLHRLRDRHRRRHVRLPRHRLRHQHPALGHPGVHAADDLDRVLLPEHHGRGAVPGEHPRHRAVQPRLGAHRRHGA